MVTESPKHEACTESVRFEPLFYFLSHLGGSNSGPYPYEGYALPTELRWLGGSAGAVDGD